MSEDIQSKEGDCQIACFDSSLPQIVCMECRRNHEDELKGIWQSWDDAKKMHFWDKYGDVAQLLFVKLDNALLKAMVHFWDPTYRCFMFNEVDMVLPIEEYSTLLHYDFRDLLRIYSKQNTDFRGPLANVMGLLVDTVKARPIEEFLESEWPLNQSIEEWVQNLSTLAYQEIEWRALWMIRSMVFAQQAEEICEQIEELKTESTLFATKDELAMKLLKVAQARYQKFIKAMRRKKNDEWRFSLWQ
ncbi:hypothetical protein Gotri_011565 [Gossypium trilobum]|uniref:DUF7745 domain-containing protein n=1 Tax=Gossypium trilobum TaxID=34281 RepID=A0A7J9EV40_9ROSI|nr:hypothetical protein [Gossypium trilobum]